MKKGKVIKDKGTYIGAFIDSDLVREAKKKALDEKRSFSKWLEIAIQNALKK